jgi:demethylmenaquinone methyltransferase / 2-methoxy-6-polyprenyl-1,4-benzoquinol methylase
MPVSDNPRDDAVQSMFDRIAGRYDLLNRVISFRLDAWWRIQVIQAVSPGGKPLLLDLGSGTGDLTFAAAKASHGNARTVGLDFSYQMLRRAQIKKCSAPYGDKTSFVLGSALRVPFKDGVFDGVMTAFVLRNVSELSLFFAHAFRVLKPGGKFVSLDMFPPSKGWFSAVYALYFYQMVPWIGGLLARDRNAYKYLSESVQSFPPPETIASLIEDAGFQRVTLRRFLRGAVCMHVGEKGDATSARRGI